MAISDTITSMYENVGNVYDVLELAGADLTNVDKNIFNLKQSWEERLLYFLANGTDVVWNNWLPKVNGTGENITLNNTIQAKMDFVYKGNTSQESTTGKNLIKQRENASMGITTTPNSDGSVTINGTTTTNWFTIGNTMNISIPAGTYTFSIQNTLSFNVRLDFTYNDDTYVNIGTITAGNTSRTFTLEKTTKSVFIEATNTTSGTQINETIKFMLESGSSATSFEPYTGGNPAPNPDYPYPVNVVTGDNEVKVEGKNLINVSLLDNKTVASVTYTPQNDQSLLINGTKYGQNNVNFNGYKLHLQVGTYTLTPFIISGSVSEEKSNVIKIINSNNEEINIENYFLSNPRSSQFVITKEDDYYIRFSFGDGFIINNVYLKLQIEKGSTASEYQPYQSQAYPINLGSMELCKIGDYQDHLYKENDKWYKYGAIGKYTFTGNEYIEDYSGSTYAFAIYVNNMQKLYNASSVNVVCNKLTGSTTNNIYSNRNTAGYNLISSHTNSGTSSIFLMMINNYTTSSTEEIKTYLTQQYQANTPMIAYYIELTPTITEITDTTLLSQLETIKLSYNEQTNISQENDNLPFELDVVALGELEI